MDLLISFVPSSKPDKNLFWWSHVDATLTYTKLGTSSFKQMSFTSSCGDLDFLTPNRFYRTWEIRIFTFGPCSTFFLHWILSRFEAILPPFWPPFFFPDLFLIFLKQPVSLSNLFKSPKTIFSCLTNWDYSCDVTVSFCRVGIHVPGSVGILKGGSCVFSPLSAVPSIPSISQRWLTTT